jgi:hypothetical protein
VLTVAAADQCSSSTSAEMAVHVLQNMLRQKEAELKQANAELEERGKLLYKTKVCS